VDTGTFTVGSAESQRIFSSTETRIIAPSIVSSSSSLDRIRTRSWSENETADALTGLLLHIGGRLTRPG